MTIFHDQQIFMSATGQEPNPRLYRELVREEYGELTVGWLKYDCAPTTENSIELADAIMDSIYVLAGLANSLYGPDIAQRMWEEVQRSNMSKCVFEDGKFTVLRRADGKVQKPPTFSPPDLFSIITGIEP
jgi:hypothetical protein